MDYSTHYEMKLLTNFGKLTNPKWI